MLLEYRLLKGGETRQVARNHVTHELGLLGQPWGPPLPGDHPLPRTLLAEGAVAGIAEAARDP